MNTAYHVDRETAKDQGVMVKEAMVIKEAAMAPVKIAVMAVTVLVMAG
jgi:hypothetical protein